MTVTVGLVGFGLAGRFLHAPLIRAAGLSIAAVVSSRTAEITEDLPQARALPELPALLERSDIDLVVIATPTHRHAEQIEACLRADKHVVVDKPFAVSAEQAEHLIALADARNLKLSVYHNRRWDSDYLTIKRLLDAGTLGEPVSFQMRWDRYRPGVQDRWREKPLPGSGLLYDLGAHLIDQALTLFGPPDWVQADVFMQKAGGTVDDGFEILWGCGRRRVSLGVASIVADGGYRYRVHGTAGSFLKAGLDLQEAQLRAGMDPLDPAFGEEPEAQWGRLVSGEGCERRVPSERGRWLSFYEAMAGALRDGGPLPVEPREAARVIALIEAARESAEHGRRVAFASDGRAD